MIIITKVWRVCYAEEKGSDASNCTRAWYSDKKTVLHSGTIEMRGVKGDSYDRNKLSDRGCEGAPDWVIEITSPSTQWNDSTKKFTKYQSAGVRLYWIVNPEKRIINVYDFEKGEASPYSFSDFIPVSICAGFEIRLEDIL